MSSASRFTGKERDSETGLDYFGARYFAGAQGMFTSPDPEGASRAHVANPQKCNMYAYVLNNPLIMVDPNGEAEYHAFRTLVVNGVETIKESSPGWKAIQAYTNRPGSPDKMTIYNGSEATAANYTKALQTEGAIVIFVGHTAEFAGNNGIEAGSVLMTDNVGVGTSPPEGGTLVPVPGMAAGNVGLFACNSDDLASQYKGTTFTATGPTTNSKAQDSGAAAYADQLTRGGDVGQAATAAKTAMVRVTKQVNSLPQTTQKYETPRVCTTVNGVTKCQ